MADDEGVRLSVAAVLLRPGQSPPACITPTFTGIATLHRWRDDQLVAVKASDLSAPPQNQTDVVVVLFRKVVSPPRWQQFIEDAFGIAGFVDSVRGSRGAMVFCPVQDPADREGPLRWVAWTFGSASQGIRPGSIDPRFGLLTALNRMSDASPPREFHRGRIRQFEYRQFGAYRQRTSHQAARDTPLEGFRFDKQMDLLSGVGGPRSDRRGHVYGGRPLRQRERVDGPAALVRLAQAAIEDYRRESYSADFPFIDDYVLVDDPILLARLRLELFADIVSGADNVDVFLPDDLPGKQEDQAIEFILFPGEQTGKASRLNLTIEGLRRKIVGGEEGALDWTIRFCDANRDVVGDASVFECLAAEIVIDGDRFLLSDGSFFKVDASFISRINAQIEDLTITNLQLPCYPGKSEGAWNSAVATANPDEFVCLDGSLIHLPGETPFEPADLIHVSGCLVHVKRKGRSSALSYVFVQARRSCQLLSVPQAREELRDNVESVASETSKPAFANALLALDKSPSSMEVVLALLGDWKGKDLKNLPLLAKLELVDACQAIGLYGFRPCVALVDLCRDPADLAQA